MSAISLEVFGLHDKGHVLNNFNGHYAALSKRDAKRIASA